VNDLFNLVLTTINKRIVHVLTLLFHAICVFSSRSVAAMSGNHGYSNANNDETTDSLDGLYTMARASELGTAVHEKPSVACAVDSKYSQDPPASILYAPLHELLPMNATRSQSFKQQ
jgi:hypothetical protein